MESDLIRALINLHGAMPIIGKDAENPHFRSRYSTLEAMHRLVLPILDEHGFAVVQHTVVHENGGATLTTQLFHETLGLAGECDWPLPAIPEKPQALGSALTYARRYSLMTILGLVSGDDDDGNAVHAAQASTITDRPAPVKEKRKIDVPEHEMKKTPGEATRVPSVDGEPDWLTFAAVIRARFMACDSVRAFDTLHSTHTDAIVNLRKEGFGWFGQYWEAIAAHRESLLGEM